jgi:hypothetical protein
MSTYTESKIRELIRSSNSFGEIAVQINLNTRSTRKLIVKKSKKYNIDISHLYERAHKEVPKTISCISCGKETTNPKFCSKSCSAKETNKKPKRVKINHYYCSICGSEIDRKITKRCKACIANDIESKKNLTIGSLRNKISVKGKHRSWLHSEVLLFNRFWNKDLTIKPCQNCNYSKHVELAHIKSVASHDDSALLSEVNHPNNIIVLCRNCHWEFDHFVLKLEDIPSR